MNRWRREAGDTTVVGVLLMPLLALALGAVLHLGLYLLARQTTVTAVQQGVTAAATADASTTDGEAITRQLIADHSAAQTRSVSSTTTETTVTMTVTVRSPGLVPGLPRDLTVTQTAVREEFLTAP
jgi:Flp pilus assembly protein TadG